jgi:outer membrane beta-barrel protein
MSARPSTLGLLTAMLVALIPNQTLASEGDLYDFLWLDPDKKVYVLQNKVYKKERSFYFSLGYLYGMTNEFQDTYGGHLSMGYYFNEEWAFEVFGNKYKNSNNEAYENLTRINSSVPFVRRFESFYGGMVVWSPFYGKINTFNKIFYFDWSVGLGAGKVETESNALTAADPNVSTEFAKESYTGGALKTGLRFHATENIHINIEYLRTTYKAPGPTIEGRPGQERYRVNSDLIFSIGFSF